MPGSKYKVSNSKEPLKPHLRIHVLDDLQPYVCTAPNCSDGTKTFRNRALWIKHEVHHQIPETPMRVCPFCPSLRGNVLSEMYYRHVGHHLREVCLAVLPQGHDIGEAILNSSRSDSGQLSDEETKAAEAMSVDEPPKEHATMTSKDITPKDTPVMNVEARSSSVTVGNSAPEIVTQPCKYITGKTIGAGEYWIMKECVNIDTGHYYTAKVISKRLMTGQEHRVGSSILQSLFVDLQNSQVRNEIAVLKRVSQSTSILALIDYFETANNSKPARSTHDWNIV